VDLRLRTPGLAKLGAALLGNPDESDIVADHCGGPNRQRFGASNVEFLKLDVVLPDLSKEILEDLNGQLLAGTAAIAKAEWREARIVAYRKRLAVDDAVSGAEPTIVN